MKQLILFFTITIQLSLFAQVPANYYNSAVGLTEYTLKTELKDIINNNYNSLSYNTLYTVFETSDADSYYENDGTVLDMYSEIPSGADSYSYAQIYSNRCTGSASYTAENECYNREHIVPQIVFNYQFPMKSDAHFVFPVDGYVNLKRSSYAYGEVSTAVWTSSNGSKKGNNTTAGYSSYVFEPIDEFKGDIARALFYFATMYEDSVANWNHTMFNNTSDQVFEDWFLAIILDWHENDPVDARDIQRNNVIYSYQNNANPFVDHPEWVNAIWNPNPDVTSPSDPTNLVASTVTSNSVVLDWDASTDNVSVYGYDVYRDGSLITTSNTNSFIDNGLSALTSYSYYVVAKDLSGNLSANSNTEVITTVSVPEFLITEDFNDCSNMTTFVTFSEVSNKDWHCKTSFGYNNTACIQMNGYNEDVASKDWLITNNKVEFSNYDDEKISIYLAHAYGTMSLDLVYSTDYDGTSDPSSFIWTAIPNVVIETNSGNYETIQNVVNVDISALDIDAYVAFKYYSNGNPTRWTVDNFDISGTLKNVSDGIAPTAPTNLVTSNITINSVDLNWDASTDNVSVSEYEIYRDGGLINSTTNLNYTDNGLTENTTYAYYIVAKDAAGNSSNNSNTENITTAKVDFINEVFSNYIKIYPNPITNNSITVEYDELVESIELYSILGDLINDIENNNSNKVVLTDVIQGIYFLRIKINGEYFIKKIISY